MQSRAVIPLLLILAVILQPTTLTGHATSVPQQGVSFGILPDYVSVSVNFQIFQNLTQLDSSFTLPQFNGVLTQTNSTAVTSAIQQALIVKSPTAKVDSLGLGLATTAWNSNLNSQWFNISLQFHVRGVQTLRNGVGTVDMSWRSFSALQNVTIGGVEVNNIGSKYLASVAASIAQTESSSTGTFITYTNTVNSFRTRAANMAVLAAEISLFNFTKEEVPLDSWHQGYDFSSGSVTWSFKPALLPGIIVTESIAEQQPPTLSSYVLTYRITASLSAPTRSSVHGNTVIAPFGDNTPTIMIGIIASVAVIGSVSYFYEARALNRGTRKKQKR